MKRPKKKPRAELLISLNTNLNNRVYTDEMVNIIFHWTDKTPVGGQYYYTNSIYIPADYTLNVQTAMFLGSSGNFASQIKLSQRGCYLYFYSDNANFAGLDMSIEAYMVKQS